MSEKLEWPEGMLGFRGRLEDGRKGLFYLSCPRDGKVFFMRRVNNGLRVSQLPAFPFDDAIVLFAKLIASALAPQEIRIPIEIVRGRRPERGSDEIFPVASEMRERVEAYARAHIKRVDLPPQQRSALLKDGVIHLSNGRDELRLIYNRELDLIYFDREKIPVDLLLDLSSHVLRDELTREVDNRYHFAWLPVLRPNLWKSGDPVPEPRWGSKRLQIAVPPAAVPELDDLDTADDVLEESLDHEAALAPQDPDIVLGLLREVAPRIEQPLTQGEATEALRPVLHAAIAAMITGLEHEGVAGRKPAITTVAEIPEALRAPFVAYVEQLLEEGFDRVRAQEARVLAKAAEDKHIVDAMLEDIDARIQAVERRELEVEGQEAVQAGRSAQLDQWERKLAEARQELEADLLHRAYECIAASDGRIIRKSDRRKLEEAKFIVGHLRRRDVDNSGHR